MIRKAIGAEKTLLLDESGQTMLEYIVIIVFSKFFLLGAQALAAVGLLFLFFFSQHLIFASAFIMLALCASLTYYSSIYYTVRLMKKKGKGAGLHESILGSGVVLGPLLGGIMAHSAGLRAPYLLCLGVLALVIIIELSIIRRFRRLRRFNGG